MHRVNVQVFLVQGSFIDGIGTGKIDSFAVVKVDILENWKMQDKYFIQKSDKSYQRSMPFFTFSYRSFPSALIGRIFLRSGSRNKFLKPQQKSHIYAAKMFNMLIMCDITASSIPDLEGTVVLCGWLLVGPEVMFQLERFTGHCALPQIFLALPQFTKRLSHTLSAYM